MKAGRKLAIAAAAALLAAGSPAQQAEAPVLKQAGDKPMVHLREYQAPVVSDKTTKVLLLEWSRQIGKSHTLSHWCADRALERLIKMLRGELGGKKDWLIVVISNSKSNGAEFGIKCADACDVLRAAIAEESAMESAAVTAGFAITDPELLGSDDPKAPAGTQRIKVEDFAHRIEIRAGDCKVRILILAASPRTCRGFSGDLVLDEFAFHENAKAIWDAVEPIISANPEYLCRIASTHNGPRSLFCKWIRTKFFPVVSIKRSRAWQLSRHDPIAPYIITSLRRNGPDGKPAEITPDEARAEADDLKMYDQNYELIPSAEAGALLTYELITRASRAPQFVPCLDEWDTSTLQRIYRTACPLWLGWDVGRNKDRSVISAWAETGSTLRLAGVLRITGNLIVQCRQMEAFMAVCGGMVQRMAIDRTGIGQGVVDHLALKYGSLVLGISFSEKVPLGDLADAEQGWQKDDKQVMVPVRERMALDLLKRFLDDSIEIIAEHELHESLHNPERIVKENGDIQIAAQRTVNEDGSTEHADFFWSAALAEHARQRGAGGAWTEDDLAGAEVGACGVQMLRPFTGFHPSPFHGGGIFA